MGLGRYFFKAYQKLPRSESTSEHSDKTTSTAPVAPRLISKTEAVVSPPEQIDLGVADQLLVQSSRQTSNSSNLDPFRNEIVGQSGSSLVSGISFAKTTQEIRPDTPLDTSKVKSTDLYSSILESPRTLALVPAKRFRRSSGADPILLDAKENNPSPPRKPSNQSVLSDKSNATVCHDPSKRCPSPIAILDAVPPVDSLDPFSDHQAINRASKQSSDFPRSQNTTVNDSSVGLGSSEDFIFSGGRRGRQISATVVPSDKHGQFRLFSTLSDRASLRILEGTDIARREFARSKAFLAFNTSAPYLNLEALNPPRTATQISDAPVESRPGSFLRRIRTARSALTLGNREQSAKRKIRRMKTLANLASQYRPGALVGRSLEDLARLGGESILSNLPPRYFPGTLKLPTCIAATVNALLNHGTATPFIHRELGNREASHDLYSYYAGQVLGAEKLKEKINKTTRPVEIPLEHLKVCGHGNGGNYLHVISTVLKHFLAEIPGGILGSVRLYHAFEKIQSKDFTITSCDRDPYQKAYLPNLEPVVAAKVRMIALALTALTTDAQLELICAIFGLLSVTADESNVTRQFHNTYLHPKSQCKRCEGLTDSTQLGFDFAHLLNGMKGVELEAQSKTGRNMRAVQVITMLIDTWKHVSFQLWQWELIDT